MKRRVVNAAVAMVLASCGSAAGHAAVPRLFPHPLVEFRSVNPKGNTPGFRWVQGDHWEFGGPGDGRWYDIMRWNGNVLEYSETNNNGEIVTFTPPIQFGGHDGTGAGSSTAHTARCTGHVEWQWAQGADNLQVEEQFTGGCGTYQWEENWQWDAKGPVRTKGGQIPYQDDTQHWDLERVG